MLGGNDPVIIITFTTPRSEILGIPIPQIPILPIPIYLNEEKTGIMGNGTENSIAIAVEKTEKGDFQKEISQDLTLRLQVRNDNVVAQVLLATMKQIFNSVPKDAYFVTIFYDTSFIIQGKLKGFISTPVEGTNLRDVVLTVSDKMEEEAVLKAIKNLAGDNWQPLPNLGA